MSGLTTEYCVEIRVPKKFTGKNKFGSGYTLGSSWVLTAYHVLFGTDVDESKPIEITWWDESAKKVKGGAPVSARREDILWWHRKHDIALIKCKPPYSDVPGALNVVAMDRPQEGSKCKCGGFLINLLNEERQPRRKTPCGILGNFSAGEIKADINGLNVSLGEERNWAGFSGSPVFIADKLTAVVVRVNTGERGGSISASFIGAALDSKGDGRGQPVLRDLPDFLISSDKNYKTLFTECTSIHYEFPLRSMRICFPAVECVSLETVLESRWGLWRMSLIGLLSGVSKETLRSSLRQVEQLLHETLCDFDLTLPYRCWNYLEVNSTLRPPNDLNALNKMLSPKVDDMSEIYGNGLIPGLILVFEAPRLTALRRKYTIGNRQLEEQVSEWLHFLFNKVFAGKQLAVICIMPEVNNEFVNHLYEEFSDIPVEWLTDTFSKGPCDCNILQAWDNQYVATNTISKENTLSAFKRLLDGECPTLDWPVPSHNAVFLALTDLDNDTKKNEFWDLLEHSGKINTELSEELVAQAASSEDTVLADVALRFAKRHDRLIDAWLEARFDSHKSLFLDPWLGTQDGSCAEFNLMANPSFGGSFINELGMAMARLSVKSNKAKELLNIIGKYTDPHLSKIMKVISEESDYNFQLFDGVRDALFGFRCNLLELFPSSSFSSLRVDWALPFWLILAHQPNKNWLSVVLNSRCSVRAVFGLLTEQEIIFLIENKKLISQIKKCRRSDR